MKLVLPFPPSVNTYWRAPNKGPLKGRHLISEKGRAYQSAECAAIIEQLRCLPKPSSSPAAVEILLFPPDARRRDIDNYNKALFDALTHAGIWEDDSRCRECWWSGAESAWRKGRNIDNRASTNNGELGESHTDA